MKQLSHQMFLTERCFWSVVPHAWPMKLGDIDEPRAPSTQPLGVDDGRPLLIRFQSRSRRKSLQPSTTRSICQAARSVDINKSRRESIWMRSRGPEECL